MLDFILRSVIVVDVGSPNTTSKGPRTVSRDCLVVLGEVAERGAYLNIEAGTLGGVLARSRTGRG